MPVAAADGLRHTPQYLELRARFPVLDGRDDLVDELLDLFTPRNLYALHAIGAKIDRELRDPGTASVMRLALATCLLPASRLNGYPGRVASLRIAGGHVRQPASRHQREVNVWRASSRRTATCAPPRRAVRDDRRRRTSRPTTASSAGWAPRTCSGCGRARPSSVSTCRARGSISCSGAPPRARPSTSSRSSTSPPRGSSAGRRPRPCGSSRSSAAARHPEGAEATALRHGLASAVGALKPGGWCNLLLDDGDPTGFSACALPAAAAGLELVDVIHRESGRSGDGIVLHLRKPSAEDRLRQAVAPSPLRLGADAGHLTYPELAAAIDRAAVGSCSATEASRPGLTRVVAAIVAELGRSGLLRRLARARAPATTSRRGERLEGGGPQLLASLVHEELWRDDHPTLVRIGDDRGRRGGCATGAGRAAAGRSRRVGDLVDPVDGRPHRRGRLLRPHLPALPGAPGAGRGAGARLPGVLRGAGRARLARDRRRAAPRTDDHARDDRHARGLRPSPWPARWIASREHDRAVDGARWSSAWPKTSAASTCRS